MQYNHLPHLDLPEQHQFITFRSADSTDDFLQKIIRGNRPNSETQMLADSYLDSSGKGAYLQGDVLSYFTDFLLDNNKILYDLTAYAVMPNHVHLLLKPLLGLSVMMQRIKGGSAKRINEIRGCSGRFWAKDYYDKGIRDENHFKVVYNYLKNNPLKCGGADSQMLRFYGVYEA